MTEPTLYFVRHGESETNAADILAGQRDVALTEKGIEQARKLGRELSARHFHADTIIASDLKRAQTTAEIIAKAVGYSDPIIIIGELRESYGGGFEGRPNREYHAASDADIIAAGGESREDFAARVVRADALVRMRARGVTIVVAHKGVYRMMKTLAEAKSPQLIESAPVPPNATLLEYPQIVKATASTV